MEAQVGKTKVSLQYMNNKSHDKNLKESSVDFAEEWTLPGNEENRGCKILTGSVWNFANERTLHSKVNKHEEKSCMV